MSPSRDDDPSQPRTVSGVWNRVEDTNFQIGLLTRELSGAREDIKAMAAKLDHHLTACQDKHRPIDVLQVRTEGRLDVLDKRWSEYSTEYSKHGRTHDVHIEEHKVQETRIRALEDALTRAQAANSLLAKLWPSLLAAAGGAGGTAAILKFLAAGATAPLGGP